MPKSTTSKQVAAHCYARHTAFQDDNQWLTEAEETGQPMANLKHGAARNRKRLAPTRSEGGDSRGMFEGEDNFWHEYCAPDQIQTNPPQQKTKWQSSATSSSSGKSSQGRPEYRLRGDVDWSWSNGSCILEREAIAEAEDSDVDTLLGNPGNEDNVGVTPWMNWFESTARETQATINRDMNQRRTLLETETPTTPIRRCTKVLPDWVHPKWVKKFLPTLTHVLYISKDPFDEFRSSSSTFIATVERIFRLVYPNAKYDITENGVLVEEAAQRLIVKRSKIASVVMENVKQFFEQPQYANRPDDVKAYARWALLPDGPAFHKIPTPISCKFERGHKDYIPPSGTFQSLFISKAAKYFLLQTKGSVLDHPICASNPPKGLYALLLVSVERAFTAFYTGSHIKLKAKFSHENYHTHLETYLTHLDTVSQRSWEKILYQVNASDLIGATVEECAEASAMSINRQNIFIADNVKEV